MNNFTLYSENFDSLPLKPFVSGTEGNGDGTDFTTALPSGWRRDNRNTPIGGPQEFFGWVVLDKNSWIATAGDQQRSGFTAASGNVLVADPDEYDDGVDVDSNRFSAYTITKPIDVEGFRNLTISFDSSWLPEDRQSAVVSVRFDGGEWSKLQGFASSGSEYKAGALSERLTYNVNPSNAPKQMEIAFDMSQAGNDWWWAIDNLQVAGEMSESQFLPEPGQKTTFASSFVQTSQDGDFALGHDGQVVRRTSPSGEWRAIPNSTGFHFIKEIEDDRPSANPKDRIYGVRDLVEIEAIASPVSSTAQPYKLVNKGTELVRFDPSSNAWIQVRTSPANTPIQDFVVVYETPDSFSTVDSLLNYKDLEITTHDSGSRIGGLGLYPDGVWSSILGDRRVTSVAKGYQLYENRWALTHDGGIYAFNKSGVWHWKKYGEIEHGDYTLRYRDTKSRRFLEAVSNQDASTVYLIDTINGNYASFKNQALRSIPQLLSTRASLNGVGNFKLVSGQVQLEDARGQWNDLANSADFTHISVEQDGQLYGVRYSGVDSYGTVNGYEIVRFNPGNQTWTSIKTSDKYVRDLAVRDDGVIAYLIEDGELRYLWGDGSVYGWPNPEGIWKPLSDDNNARVMSIERDSEGDIWFLLNDGLLKQYDYNGRGWTDHGYVSGGNFHLQLRENGKMYVLGAEQSYVIDSTSGTAQIHMVNDALNKSAAEVTGIFDNAVVPEVARNGKTPVALANDSDALWGELLYNHDYYALANGQVKSRPQSSDYPWQDVANAEGFARIELGADGKLYGLTNDGFDVVRFTSPWYWETVVSTDKPIRDLAVRKDGTIAYLVNQVEVRFVREDGTAVPTNGFASGFPNEDGAHFYYGNSEFVTIEFDGDDDLWTLSKNGQLRHYKDGNSSKWTAHGNFEHSDYRLKYNRDSDRMELFNEYDPLSLYSFDTAVEGQSVNGHHVKADAGLRSPVTHATRASVTGLSSFRIHHGQVQRQDSSTGKWNDVANSKNFIHIVASRSDGENESQLYGVRQSGSYHEIHQFDSRTNSWKYLQSTNKFIRDLTVLEGQLVEYLAEDGEIYNVKPDGGWVTSEAWKPFGDTQRIDSIVRDSDEDLWLLTGDGGLYEIKEGDSAPTKRGQVRTSDNLYELQHTNLQLRHLAEDRIHVVGEDFSYEIDSADPMASLRELSESEADITGIEASVYGSPDMFDTYAKVKELREAGILEAFANYNEAEAEFKEIVKQKGSAATREEVLPTLKEMSKFARTLTKAYRQRTETKIEELKTLEKTIKGSQTESVIADARKRKEALKADLKASETQHKKFEALLGVTGLALTKFDTFENGSGVEIAKTTLSGLGSLWELSTETLLDKAKASKSTNPFVKGAQKLTTKTFKAEVGKGVATKAVSISADALALYLSIEEGENNGWSDADIIKTTANGVALATDLVSLVPKAAKFQAVGLITEYALLGAYGGVIADTTAGKVKAITNAFDSIVSTKLGPVLSTAAGIVDAVEKDADVKAGLIAASFVIAKLPIPGARIISGLISAFTAALDMDAINGETATQRKSGWYNTLDNIPIIGHIAALTESGSRNKAEANAQSQLEKAFLDTAREGGIGDWEILYTYKWHEAFKGNRRDTNSVQYQPEGTSQTGRKLLGVLEAKYNTSYYLDELEDEIGADRTMEGSDKDDIIYTSENTRVNIKGEGGNDLFYVGNNAPENDDETIFTPTFDGGEGRDVLSFENLDSSKYHNLRIDLTQYSSQVKISVKDGSVEAPISVRGFEVIKGSNEGDWIENDDQGTHLLQGGDGVDTLLGGNGDDVFLPGKGLGQVISGRAGWDSIAFDDLADGLTFVGAGDGITSQSYLQTLFNQNSPFYAERSRGVSALISGIDHIYVTDGNDKVVLNRYTEKVFIDLKNGNDLLVATDRDNVIDTGTGKDIVVALGGSDTIYLSGTQSVVDGGDGYDILRLSDDIEHWISMNSGKYGLGNQLGGYYVSGHAHSSDLEFGHVTAFAYGVEAIVGGERNDHIGGSYGSSVLLDGGPGNDSLSVNSGNSRLLGGEGDDWLTGGNDRDTLIGGVGNDTYQMGFDSNEDLLLFSRGDGQDKILNNTSADKVQFGSDFHHHELNFDRSGNDLVVSAVESTDKITVTDYFRYTDRQGLAIETSTHKLKAGSLQSLIDATTGSYASRDALGDITLTDAAQTAIDAAWEPLG